MVDMTNNKTMPSYSADALTERGVKRAKALPRRLGVTEDALHDARVLEFGCGFGEVTAGVESVFGARPIGVDIRPRWENGPFKHRTDLYRNLDITVPSQLARLDEPIDFVHSYTVFEHVRHPKAAIRALHRLIRPGGRAYLNFNLYRGASASHLMQKLGMPWVHLTHSDAQIRQMMRDRHGIDQGACWVNKLTYAHYLSYFRDTGFEVDSVWYDIYRMPEDLLKKYEEIFAPYPEEDLIRNFMHVRLLRS